MGSDGDWILSAHNQRLTRLDRYLPAAPALPEAPAGTVLLTAPAGQAIARCRDVDLDSFAASWSPARTCELQARVAEPQAMAALLSQWEPVLTEAMPPGQHDIQAVISWPSRDTAMTGVFLRHSLVPRSTLAVRPAGRALASDSSIAVWPLTQADIKAASALWLDVIRWDAQFAAMTVRRSTRTNIEHELAEAAAAEDPWIWLAENQGEPVGLIVAEPPDRAGWVASSTVASPVAYISCLP